MSSRMNTELRNACLEAIVDADGKAVRRYELPVEFCGFAGHFPGRPVVPAIVQMLMAQQVAADLAGHPVRLTRVLTAKFLIKLGPRRTITVTASRRTNAKDGFELDVRVLCDEGVAARLRLEFENEEDLHA